jgi:predicted transcriptional regulator
VVRNRIEIIAQILEVVNEGSDDGVTKTKIMYKAFLNYAQLKEYLTILTDNGLVMTWVLRHSRLVKKLLCFLKPAISSTS